jgi:hypothetical protein
MSVCVCVYASIYDWALTIGDLLNIRGLGDCVIRLTIAAFWHWAIGGITIGGITIRKTGGLTFAIEGHPNHQSPFSGSLYRQCRERQSNGAIRQSADLQ